MVPESRRHNGFRQVAIEYVWYGTAPGRHKRPGIARGQGHEILVKPLGTLSYCYPVNLIAVQLERYRSVADRNRLRRSASQHHGRRAEAGGEAESPVATSQRSGRVAHRAGRTTSRSTQTSTGTPSAARGPVMVKLARLEREASSCNDGCKSSFKRGKDPWVGCSESGGYYSTFSATCKDTLTHRDYGQCVETKMFLGWDRQRSWWYCTGMLAGGRFRVTAQNRNR